MILGGGNSGLEEGIFLTQFAKHVTVFERGAELRASKILQEKVRNHPQMSIRVNEALEEFVADSSGKLSSMKFKNLVTGEMSEIKTNGAFLFIGLDPNTGWLNASLKLDERKFIATNEMFATSMEGVFAAGDVRSGSTKQLAAAVGEGAAVAIQIRYFLDRVEAANKI